MGMKIRKKKENRKMNKIIKTIQWKKKKKDLRKKIRVNYKKNKTKTKSLVIPHLQKE